MASSRSQPPWTAPKPAADTKLPPLKIYNSLTRAKNPFVPLDPEGKKVLWYACGPTVYDVSHLGHARNYVSTDIIRRILRDYFEFDTHFVMNITDVDDKIILRARQQHFLSQFKAKHPTVDEQVISTTRTAFDAYIRKNLPLVSEDISANNFTSEATRAYQHVQDGKSLACDGSPPGDKEAKIKMHLKTSERAALALKQAESSSGSVSRDAFYSATEDVLLPYLDSLYGTSINPYDHTIFTTLTKKYENLFFEDMRSLNVLDPDKLTRVTEFGPQIVQFVDKLVNKGFAYATSDGSVYFDISSYEKAGNPYARLEPWNRGDKDLQADGEGALSKKTTEKKSEADFALWKGSKAGEPAWKSPWGGMI
jgi:cysteinyl-tRNA synthetase